MRHLIGIVAVCCGLQTIAVAQGPGTASELADDVFGLRDFIYTNRFAVVPHPQGTAVSFEIQSGTVVDVLNRLMEAADTVLWIASYRPNAQAEQRFPSWDLQMQLRGAALLHGLTESH